MRGEYSFRGMGGEEGKSWYACACCGMGVTRRRSQFRALVLVIVDGKGPKVRV